MPSLNAIILSNTKDKFIYQMTMNCINSLVEAEEKNFEIKIDVLLIESNKEYLNSGFKFPDFVKVFVPEEEFNFHKYLNIGIKDSHHDFVALCNNDLIFHKNWFSEILEVKKNQPRILSFSPLDPAAWVTKKYIKSTKSHYFGYKVREHIAGWCIIADRILFDKIGLLDERFRFYYADDDYSMTLKKNNVIHALVVNSHVTHLGGQVTKSINSEIKMSPQVDVPSEKVKDLPKYLLSENYRWVLKNEKMLEAHLIFHNKWGSRKQIAFKDRIRNFLSVLNQHWIIRKLYNIN